MAAAEINGTSLEYWESGSGASVFFVHGSLADYRTWHRQKGPFSRHYRAVGYSRRCHFPNPAADAGRDYSAASHAADLAELIRQLAGRPVHIVASSFGGYIALYLAVHQPALVRSLVLGEPPLFPWLEEILGGAPLLASFMNDAWEPARRSFAGGRAEEGIRFFLDAVLGPGLFDAMKPGARSGILDNAAEMALEAASPGYFSRLTREEVSRMTKPVLLLGGEKSPPIFAPILSELERCLPCASRCTIPGASHSLHIENPAAYNAAVLGFLGEELMAPATIKFRPCEIGDLDTLRAIAYRTYDEAFRHMNTPADMDAYMESAFTRAKLEEELRNPLSAFLFLYSDGVLAGYMKINEGAAQTDLADPAALEVERIYVVRDFQGLGLGRALIEKALEIARRKEKSFLWLGVWQKNENATAFYERMGFRKAGTHPFVMGTDRQTDWIMRRAVNEG